ncbi:MAG: efflux RND transporter permease subunit [Halobacteriovoraceae bacterium]|nr:efflux RND transporter permease subunit [Halobacteriovoraceae bacterium]
MGKLAKFFIENYKLTVVISGFLIIYGVQGLFKMNAESFPSVNMGQAIITTVYRGASAEDIETKITKPIEDEIRQVSGLKDVRSTSQSGLSTIVVRADIDNVEDVDEVMSDIQKAVDRTTKLPVDLEEAPKFVEINSEEFPVLEVAVVGNNDGRLRDKVADALKEEFEDNKNVKEARLTGFAQREFVVKLDQQKLHFHHIGVDEVIQKIKMRNISVPGGSLKGSDDQKLLRIEGKVKSSEELGNVLIRSNFTGQQILLKDVAEVLDSEKEITTKAQYNGEDATLVVVSKKGGSDTIKLVKDLTEVLSTFQKRYDGQLKFVSYLDESIKVENKLTVLSENALTGLILVIVFLFLFLPGRIGILASLSLPFAVMATLGIMPSMGMNLDTITILALVIALGMLVDNSVVISENFTRLRQEGAGPYEAAVESVKQLWLPITGTALTTIAAFLPMLVTRGIMGQFIRFIPMIVSISLTVSLFESFFLLPMRLAHGGGKIKKENEQEAKKDWFHRFEHMFESTMSTLIRHRYIVSFVFTGILAISFYFMAVVNKFVLFPPEQTEVYVARVNIDTGSTLDHTKMLLGKLSKAVEEKMGKDIEHIVARAGISQMNPTDPKKAEGNNVGILVLRASDNTKLNIPHTEILKRLRSIKVEGIKEVTYEAIINGPPVGNDIEATFRSNSISDIDHLIEDIKADLLKVQGISNLKTDDVIGDDEVFVDIDYAKADRLGLSVNNIGNTISTAIGGKNISQVTLDNKDVDINLRFQKDYRKNLEDLGEVKIMDNGMAKNLVPVSTIASFHINNGSPQIKRFDFKKSKTLTGTVDDNLITSVKANSLLMDSYNKHKTKYHNVSLKFGGAQESTNESMASLFDALILSLIGIFALLVFLFKSFLRPAIIMSTIPLGLFGFSIAFYLHDRPISFLALIGIIGLGGIIVNSGIVLISFIDQFREEGKFDLHTILAKASGMRLRAVLVTSLTTISGLIPTAYGIGGTDPILIPMTLAMAWGLTSGTVLTLVWVPCAYAILEDFMGLFSFLKKDRKKNNSEINNLKENDVDNLTELPEQSQKELA